MQFSQLTEQAQKHAYSTYCEAMNDELNRDDIVPIDEYSSLADWDGLEFDPTGDVTEIYAIWHKHDVIGYCTMSRETATKLNGMSGTILYFGYDQVTHPERYEQEEENNG